MKQVTARLILLLSCTVLTSSCGSAKEATIDTVVDPIDRDGALTRQDFRDMRNNDAIKKPQITANLGNVVEPPIPSLAEIIAAPPKPKIGETQLVSLAVTDDVPLKDVLIEVARLANVDIDVDSSITGGVSLRATDKPFNEVIERIANMAGLRYSMKNGVLLVERDTPYMQVYTLDLLNIDRNSQSSIYSSNSPGGSIPSSGSTSSGGSSSGGSGSSGSSGATSGGSGSSSSIDYKTSGDFWVKFESGINQILSYTPAQRTSATTIAAQPAPPAQAEQGGTPAIPTPGIKPMQASGFGVAPGQPAVPSASAPIVASNQSSYILNRQAGTLSVSATQKQHEAIKRFIDKISKNASAQVLIEAKIVEVELNDTYQTGIDWKNFGTNHLNFAGTLNTVTPANTGVTSPIISVLKPNVFGSGVDLSAAVSLLDEFGTTRGLSSPRLHAVNNQQAVLSFAENLIYFKVDIDVTDAVPGTSTTAGIPAKVKVNSTQLSTPVGLVLNLQPSINTESSEVTLSIRPTLTRFVKNIPDPGFEVSKANAIAALPSGSPAITALIATHSDYPQIETRELDSIVKIKSGQALVIGGLLEDKITNTDTGVPYASEVPVIGNLFKSVDKRNSKKELVIFIRATIVGSNGNADPYDKGVYEKFIQDPRPLKF